MICTVTMFYGTDCFNSLLVSLVKNIRFLFKTPLIMNAFCTKVLQLTIIIMPAELCIIFSSSTLPLLNFLKTAPSDAEFKYNLWYQISSFKIKKKKNQTMFPFHFRTHSKL